MQVADKKGFEKRVQFYTSRDYSMQIEKGEYYPKLKPTYFIGILNFNIGKGQNYLGKHYSIEEETGMCVLGDIQHRFIQLKKFKKKRNELVTPIDKWIYFIKHAENLNVIPDDLQDEGLKLAYQEADKYTWKKEDLIAYDNVGMREQDERGRLELAVEQAVEQAKVEAETKAEEMVFNFYKLGVSIKDIAIAVQKTEKQVQQIIAKHTDKK